MSDYISVCYGNNVLVHHGIKGQKWGVRRFQNEDRTWTAAGKERYGREGGASSSSNYKVKMKSAKDSYKSAKNAYKAEKKAAKEAYKNSDEYKEARAKRLKTAAKVGATLAAAGLAAYGAYKLNDYVKNENAKIARHNGAKEVQRILDDLGKQAREDSNFSYRVNDRGIINERIRESRKDNFRTAAKNVITAKKNKIDYNDWNYSGATTNIINDHDKYLNKDALVSTYRRLKG